MQQQGPPQGAPAKKSTKEMTKVCLQHTTMLQQGSLSEYSRVAGGVRRPYGYQLDEQRASIHLLHGMC